MALMSSKNSYHHPQNSQGPLPHRLALNSAWVPVAQTRSEPWPHSAKPSGIVPLGRNPGNGKSSKGMCLTARHTLVPCIGICQHRCQILGWTLSKAVGLISCISGTPQPLLGLSRCWRPLLHSSSGGTWGCLSPSPAPPPHLHGCGNTASPLA